jgi:hypothetical protein
MPSLMIWKNEKGLFSHALYGQRLNCQHTRFTAGYGHEYILPAL